jgi:hypothetical protein
MVERSLSGPVKAVGNELPEDLSKPRWETRDKFLVLTGAMLGGIVSIMFGFGLYVLLEMGM